MAIKLMYVTNRPDVAKIAHESGVDRVFIDMEYIGKSLRQGGMDTVQNRHTVQDVAAVRKAVPDAQILVRVNPIHEAQDAVPGSEEEIHAVIEAGADLVMLPYFTTAEEVKRFVSIVNGRAKVFPLLESKAALERVDEILEIPGIDEIHVGLNDLSLDLKKKFLFELLADGTVDALCEKFRKKGIPYGFGGIGRLGKGDLPAQRILMEHYRLGSGCVILSRSFCNTALMTDPDQIKQTFDLGVQEIREYERECAGAGAEAWADNHEEVIRCVQRILEKKA